MCLSLTLSPELTSKIWCVLRAYLALQILTLTINYGWKVISNFDTNLLQRSILTLNNTLLLYWCTIRIGWQQSLSYCSSLDVIRPICCSVWKLYDSFGPFNKRGKGEGVVPSRDIHSSIPIEAVSCKYRYTMSPCLTARSVWQHEPWELSAGQPRWSWRTLRNEWFIHATLWHILGLKQPSSVRGELHNHTVHMAFPSLAKYSALHMYWALLKWYYCCVGSLPDSDPSLSLYFQKV